jgi:F0F1-type ATP synthase assembly protein I
VSTNVLAATARQAWQILVWQVGWIVAIAILSAVVFGAKAGWSILAGGAIGLIWTVYMGLTLQRHSVDYGVRLSALTFFAGWLIKVTLTFGLLLIAFRSKAMAPLPLLAGLSAALVAYWAWLTFRVKHGDGGDGRGDNTNGK